MSVYTTLTLSEAQGFAASYGLQVEAISPIQGGIQNTNYFLHTQTQDYVLTIFEELSQTQAEAFVQVLQNLAQHQLPVAVPLIAEQKAVHFLKNKPAQIAPRLMGTHPEHATLKQIEAVAIAQANLHEALKDFSFQSQNPKNHNYWMQVAKNLKPNLSVADQTLLNNLLGLYEVLNLTYPNRPKGLIHSDLFRDNTLFQNDQLCGILDFYELNHDEFLFDIAITLNDFCTDYPNLTLNEVKATTFVNAYETVRPLTSDEKACLTLYLAMAAARFWLMRLQVAQKNQQQGRTGSHILQKDPSQMRNMLVERLQFVTA